MTVTAQKITISWIVNRDGIRLGLGDSSTFSGNADLVFTHPYAQLPVSLCTTPTIVNIVDGPGREEHLSRWVGGSVARIGSWDSNPRNTLYAVRMPPPVVDVSDLNSDPPGWFPLELPLRILRAINLKPGSRVWDGFCGRATVGKACQILGLNYTGIDIRPDRVRIARDYLQV